MSTITESSRRELVERFASIVSFWAEYTNLYNININDGQYPSIDCVSLQISGVWVSSLEDILLALNYRRTVDNFKNQTATQSKISYFASTCLVVSFDCDNNQSDILKNIARILFGLIS